MLAESLIRQKNVYAATIERLFGNGNGKEWKSHGNGNWLQKWEWEWEGMGIHHVGIGENENVKSHSRSSLHVGYQLSMRDTLFQHIHYKNPQNTTI